MQIFLIEETNKSNIFEYFFKKVTVKNDKIFINSELQKLKLSQKIKLFRKINNILKINNVKNVIFSKKLKKDKDMINLFYSNGLNIIDGKILFKKLIIQIIEKICKKNNIRTQETQISITVNNVDTFSINCVKNLSKKFKTLNVVTNNLSYFKPLKEKLWEENGIIIILTNNKKKALSKTNIILNIDFPEETINKYTIYDESILINLEEEVKIKKKRFDGKIINDYKIMPTENSRLAEFLNKEEYRNFDIKDLTDVYIMNNPEELQDIIIL